MNILSYDVSCCLQSSLLCHFIVPPVIQDPVTVLMGCKHGVLGTYALEFQSSLCNCIWYIFTSMKNLNWIEEISAIVSWLQVIRRSMPATIKARPTQSGTSWAHNLQQMVWPVSFLKKKTIQSQYGDWGNTHRNVCPSWQSGSAVSRCMTTYISR